MAPPRRLDAPYWTVPHKTNPVFIPALPGWIIDRPPLSRGTMKIKMQIKLYVFLILIAFVAFGANVFRLYRLRTVYLDKAQFYREEKQVNLYLLDKCKNKISDLDGEVEHYSGIDASDPNKVEMTRHLIRLRKALDWWRSQLRGAQVQAKYHEMLVQKYTHLSFHPWEFVCPDPAPPLENAQGVRWAELTQ